MKLKLLQEIETFANEFPCLVQSPMKCKFICGNLFDFNFPIFLSLTSCLPLLTLFMPMDSSKIF